MLDTEPDYFTGQWWKRTDVKRHAVLWVLLTAFIGYVGTEVQVRAIGAPASGSMENVIHLMRVFTWAAAPVAGFAAAISIGALMGKRHYGDNPPAESDHAIKNSPRAIALWIVSSALMCLFALVVGLIALQKDDASLLDAKATHVNVVGQQWVWNFDYPGESGVRSNVLHLPVNQPVVFHVTSMDVKHSFWLVQMGVKIDANPGVFTETAVTPNKIGTFDIRCAELCGLLHAYMQNKVIVESQEDYDKWIASQPNTGETTWTEEGGNA
jgi:cytochrome c oxidase subunit 2